MGGEEIVFRVDANGKELVDVTRAGQESIQTFVAAREESRAKELPTEGGSQTPCARTRLNNVVAKLCGNLTKGSITYDAVNEGIGFRATVTLVCCGGEQFTGVLCGTSNDAKESAAEQALKVKLAESSEELANSKKRK